MTREGVYVVYYDLDQAKMKLGRCDLISLGDLKSLYKDFGSKSDSEKTAIWQQSKESPCHQQLLGSDDTTTDKYLTALFRARAIAPLDTRSLQEQLQSSTDRARGVMQQAMIFKDGASVMWVEIRLKDLDTYIASSQQIIDLLQDLIATIPSDSQEQLQLLKEQLEYQEKILAELKVEKNTVSAYLAKAKSEASIAKEIEKELRQLETEIASFNAQIASAEQSNAQNAILRKALETALQAGSFAIVGDLKTMLPLLKQVFDADHLILSE